MVAGGVPGAPGGPGGPPGGSPGGSRGVAGGVPGGQNLEIEKREARCKNSDRRVKKVIMFSIDFLIDGIGIFGSRTYNFFDGILSLCFSRGQKFMIYLG
jgi:hypothetical protein